MPSLIISIHISSIIISRHIYIRTNRHGIKNGIKTGKNAGEKEIFFVRAEYLFCLWCLGLLIEFPNFYIKSEISLLNSPKIMLDKHVCTLNNQTNKQTNIGNIFEGPNRESIIYMMCMYIWGKKKVLYMRLFNGTKTRNICLHIFLFLFSFFFVCLFPFLCKDPHIR